MAVAKRMVSVGTGTCCAHMQGTPSVTVSDRLEALGKPHKGKDAVDIRRDYGGLFGQREAYFSGWHMR